MQKNHFFSPDFSTGLLFHWSKFFAGAVINHIPQNIVEEHNNYLPVKYTFHTGAVIPLFKNGGIDTKFALEPNFVFIRQLNTILLYYGMYFDISTMSFGLFYRQNLPFHFDSMIVSYHLNMKKLTLGYSYDIGLSKLMMHSFGTHELSLNYILPCDKKIRNYNTISCPTF